jgi:hypothetical protein
LSFGLTAPIRLRCASVTSTEETAPDRMVAAVSSADHCQTGPLGSRALGALGNLRDADLLAAFATLRAAVFLVDFFGAALLATCFFLFTARLATSISCLMRRKVIGAFARCRAG